ncbi:MAG TPA: hypothetical protein VOA00_03480, partial [Thermoanaerobaculia bacterium]|nr:hypothetical protein [Thermoanaerobaculia bacterium]
VEFLIGESDPFPLFRLSVGHFDYRILREISAGFIHASLGEPSDRAHRVLTLSRSWGGGEVFQVREQIRLPSDP